MLGSPPPEGDVVGATARPISRTPLFESFFLGGFECSSHLRADGRRLDLLESTRHAELADADYARLRNIRVTACRDGAPWTFGERSDGSFDFARAASMLRAAERHGVEVIWDLLHFGWPDGLDPFAPSFPTRFGRYARAFARWISCETDARVFVTPVNEMSFLAWAGGDVRCMNPYEAARGVELKAQLVRATIEAIESIRDACPTARFLQPEPVIRIVPPPDRPKLWARVESDNLLQYQAWDMLLGRVWPSLGGHPKYLDVLGVNFYSNNQFTTDGDTVLRGDPRYEPFSEMLLEVTRRYGRPMIISETGAEGDDRAPWLRYVADECITALDAGCALHGATMYPIVNHAGWADDRHCHNGLWDYADASGDRAAHVPLLREMEAQAPRLIEARARMLASERLARGVGGDVEV
jgi:hypothetical protein